jgi:hypothetical protein
MIQKRIEQLITAYADKEISDTSELSEVNSLIENNESLRFDYEVQVLIKSLVSEKLKIKPAPVRIKNKILRKINPSKIISFFTGFFKK